MTAAPERIYNWLHTQLSIARFYGGLTYRGHDYTIAPSDPGYPLVRADVLAREAKARKSAAKAEKQAQIAKQGDLL